MSVSRRDFLKKSAAMAAFASVFPFRNLLAAENTNFTLIRRNTGFYTNRGGVIGWMVNPDASVVVDSQFADTAADCLSGIREKRDQMIDALINTHHHGDHTGGNGVFRPHARRIVAHKNVPVLQRQQSQMRGDTEVFAADTTFTSEWRMDFGDETVHATHFGPAHTRGDAVITFEKANIVHMGDLVFNRVFPFIDEAGGANVQNWINVLEATIDKHDTDTVYIFGHGQASLGFTGSYQDVRQMANYLGALIEHVQNSVAAGNSREETTGIVSLTGFEDYASFGPRLSLGANLEVVYNELIGRGE
jgi:cyclase